MSVREKVFLILMAGAIAYGLYFVAVAPQLDVDRGRAQETKVAMQALVDDMRKELRQSDVPPATRRIVRRAEKPWSEDPFLTGKLPREVAAEEAAAAEALVARDDPDPEPREGALRHLYAGFVQMQGKRLAVIDGLEYGVGDELVTGDAVVEAITPMQVVLRRKLGKGTVTLMAEQ